MADSPGTGFPAAPAGVLHVVRADQHSGSPALAEDAPGAPAQAPPLSAMRVDRLPPATSHPIDLKTPTRLLLKPRVRGS
jgi:hypothetical protein